MTSGSTNERMSVGNDAVSAPLRVFRAMRADGAKRPLCGSESNMLGVRPGIDVFPDEGGNVREGGGGLSVTPDDPARLPPHLRPARLGGRGKLPVFEAPVIGLGNSLGYRADPAHPDRHGFIESASAVLMEEFQAALAATAPAWKEVP